MVTYYRMTRHETNELTHMCANKKKSSLIFANEHEHYINDDNNLKANY